MATHDPLVLAGLKRNEVVVMDRDDATGKVEAFRPEADPQGLGVVGILRSAMFGLRTTLDLPTQSKLDRRFDFVAKGERRTADESDELRQLSDDLSTAGFANEFRDANYDRFAKAVGRVRFSDKRILSRTEIRELDEEADAVVRRLPVGGRQRSEIRRTCVVRTVAGLARSRNAATQSWLRRARSKNGWPSSSREAQVWRDLRQELTDRFGSRCWFTDAEETVAHLDIEHFRPKAEALDEDGTCPRRILVVGV